MALFKKKTEEIVETDMPAEQTEAVQDAPSEAVQDTPKPKKKKKPKDMLSSVLHESVVEAAIELFAANEPFIISIQGETQYVGLFLDTEDIGGLSKKQAKDEAKGSIVECMNAGRIAVYVTPDMLESECLVIIPNAISLDAMEEFGLLSDAPYKVAYISEDGEVSVTDTDISFADAQNILLNGKSIAEVLSLSDESDEDVTPVDESEEEPDFSEDDLGEFNFIDKFQFENDFTEDAEKPETQIIFRDDRHKKLYRDFCGRMECLDCYHRSLAYLLALDSVLREKSEFVFDFENDGVIFDALYSGFQTVISMKTTRLAFNLWNGCCYDIAEKSEVFYTPEQIFSFREYAPYYWQAIKIRFEIETND